MCLTINSHLKRPFGLLIDQIATKVTCCTEPRCGLNTSQASYTDLADIILNLPPSLPSGTTAEEVLFYNRIKDDLPAEIKGRAFWNEGANSNISAYKLEIGDQYPITVEFINGAWYQIHWQGSHIGKYAVTADELILEPATVGLGTRSRPLLHAIDTSRVHPEPSESSAELEITFASPPTDEDEPITTLVEE